VPEFRDALLLRGFTQFHLSLRRGNRAILPDPFRIDVGLFICFAVKSEQCHHSGIDWFDLRVESCG
jgi:hypothetical protein